MSAKTIKIIFVCSLLFCLIISLSCISSIIIAGDTEIVNQQRHSIITDGLNIPSRDVDVHKVITTESLWFGYDETVTIATKLETRISKAPGIVTVITAEEIKNLGYRTFAEILRTVPGFAIILPYTSESEAQLIAHEILKLVRNRIYENEKTKHLIITVSVGIVLFPEHGYDTESLLTYADLAMYRAKEEGRNRIAVFSPDQKMQIELRMEWEKRIRDALVNDRFVLHLQPISDIRQNKIFGYEALLRMIDEKGAFVPPAEFLNVAERFGLIHEIDSWVVCRAIRMLIEHQFDRKGLFLEVNLSGMAFKDPQLLSLIKQEFAATLINPKSLIFEITETAVIENMIAAQRFITSLKAIGSRFALDDFGIGFSSFNHLKHLPVDYLKIDGAFIRDLTHNTVDQHLVKAIVEVAHGLGKLTVAEFVGCKATVQLLSEYGVDYAQGYFIGYPGKMSEI